MRRVGGRATPRPAPSRAFAALPGYRPGMDSGAAAHHPGGRPRAAVVLTGSELVTGVIADANGPWLAHELTRLGFEVAHLLVVGDRPDDLAAALRFAAGAGYRHMLLDSLPSMASALGLYRALGFEEIAPYGPDTLPGLLYFGKRLGSGPGAGPLEI